MTKIEINLSEAKELKTIMESEGYETSEIKTFLNENMTLNEETKLLGSSPKTSMLAKIATNAINFLKSNPKVVGSLMAIVYGIGFLRENKKKYEKKRTLISEKLGDNKLAEWDKLMAEEKKIYEDLAKREISEDKMDIGQLEKRHLDVIGKIKQIDIELAK